MEGILGFYLGMLLKFIVAVILWMLGTWYGKCLGVRFKGGEWTPSLQAWSGHAVTCAFIAICIAFLLW